MFSPGYLCLLFKSACHLLKPRYAVLFYHELNMVFLSVFCIFQFVYKQRGKEELFIQKDLNQSFEGCGEAVTY